MPVNRYFNYFILSCSEHIVSARRGGDQRCHQRDYNLETDRQEPGQLEFLASSLPRVVGAGLGSHSGALRLPLLGSPTLQLPPMLPEKPGHPAKVAFTHGPLAGRQGLSE